MCYYDQYRMLCGCYKWGNFRQHCTREYRTGETCGTRLVMQSHSREEVCKTCQRIETKWARIQKEEERIHRWQKEWKPLGRSGELVTHPIKDVWDEVDRLKGEISSLLQERIRSNGQPGSEDAEGSEPKVLAQPSASSEDSVRSPNHNLPRKTSSSNISSSSSPNKGKEVEPTRELSPAVRFFPIDASKDTALITSWQEQVLPNIKALLCDGEDKSLSATLLRQGKTAGDSVSVVRIQSSKPRSKEREGEIIMAITQFLIPVPAPYIFFVTGSINRTARRSDLDIVPCAARNTAFLRRPPMGVSIGIDGSAKDTATLGGYIYLDGKPHILTVHHLFTDDETGKVFIPGTAITQPSLQEVKELGEMWDRLRSSRECFHLECVRKAFEDLKACLPEFSFGHLERSSGYRNRPSKHGSSNVEMDWAICKVDNRRVGSNISPCEMHFCRDTSLVTPGQDVFAIGRTSGQQNGTINGCTTSLFLQNDDGSYRESEEWAILRPESQGEETWVKSGIGVSGDSGAWILENGTDNLVGQVWGRDFRDGGNNDDTGEIITYFTPIGDIFDDILQSTGATEISLSSSSKPNKDDKQKGKKKELSLLNSVSQTPSQIGGTNDIAHNLNTGNFAIFTLTDEQLAVNCDLCANLKQCRCPKSCSLSTLIRPTSRKYFCGICHETVNEIALENVRSAPWHSLDSAMATSIKTSIKMIDHLKEEIHYLERNKREALISL